MSPRSLWITGISLFLLFVIASTPAKIVISLLSPLNNLEITGVNGTIWSGSAQNVQYKNIDFGEAHWKLSAWSLLLFSVNTDIHTKNSESQIDANIEYSFSGISSDSVKARFPAKWIPKLTNTPMQTEGKILLRLIDLKKSSDSALIVTGSIAWQQATLKTPFSNNKAQLGNLQVDISTEQETLLLNLRDNQGPLGLQANIRFNQPNKINIQGSINEELPSELANFFQFFSKPDKKGKLIINYSGIVPGL